MAVKHGQILHVANSFLVERLQTGGVSGLNQNTEVIRELGNFNSVATIRDIPDLTFDMESLDVTTDIEAMLLRLDPDDITSADSLDFNDAKPIDVISPFKAGTGLYNIVSGIAIPYLTLENATYRFGTRANATQSFTLRGDSIFYIPGTPYYGEWAYEADRTYALSNTALNYVEGGDTLHVLGLCWNDPVSGTYGRLFYGDDYTDTTTTFTITVAADALIPSTSVISAVWGSATAATYNQTVHEDDTTVKPAAVRGKDIDIYVGPQNGTLERWTSVQSFEVTRRVTLTQDEEFGNPRYVAQDYDTPDVTGNIVVRPRNPQELITKVQQVTDVPSGEVAGALSSVPLEIEARISNPDTGAVMKTLFIPDARLLPPPVQGRVNQRTDVTFSFTSDGGELTVHKGTRGAS